MEPDKKSKVKEIMEKYRRSGEIAKKAKAMAQKLCVPGANAYEMVEKIENFMRSNGTIPAFPTNVSINNEAAHYSPEILDDRIIPEEAIVKIDLGCHIDGYLVDTAITVNHNPKLEELTQSSLTALEKVIEEVKAGVKISHLGKVIDESIVNDGFQPVRNLNGHQIKRYELHAGVSIPNSAPGYFEREKRLLEAGRIYAIEPFASTGKGWIKNDKVTNIFRLTGKPSKKHKDILPIYKEFRAKVGVLPFSPRMLHEPGSGLKGKENVMANLRKLRIRGLVTGYPVLIEEDPKAMVSQHEHTLRVTTTGYELLT